MHLRNNSCDEYACFCPSDGEARCKEWSPTHCPLHPATDETRISTHEIMAPLRKTKREWALSGRNCRDKPHKPASDCLPLLPISSRAHAKTELPRVTQVGIQLIPDGARTLHDLLKLSGRNHHRSRSPPVPCTRPRTAFTILANALTYSSQSNAFFSKFHRHDELM